MTRHSEHLVLIHGWSDDSRSFRKLAMHLSAALDRDFTTIDLADWVSLDDDVTYDDLADGLEAAWSEFGLPKRGRKTDVVLHSTGALVVREWLLKHCGSAASPPIKRLLMLAPANFGSPLAHHGRSFIGRARLGFKTLLGQKSGELDRLFDSGAELLHGLELASPYTWDLAQRDRFGDGAKLFRKNRILTTVLVGNEGDSFVVAEFDGSDGVVRTSTANMNCAYAAVDFEFEPHARRRRRSLRLKRAEGAAFRLVNGFTHSDIVLNQSPLRTEGKGVGKKEARDSETGALELMKAALTVEDDQFDAWIEACEADNRRLREALQTVNDDEINAHTNLVVRVRNQYGHPVEDFVVEIYCDDDFDDDSGELTRADKRKSITRDIQRYVIDDVHTHRREPSMRCFHIDLDAFVKRVLDKRPDMEGLSISVTAKPVLADGTMATRHSAGYRTIDDGEIGHVFISREELADVFRPHQTLMLDFTIQRLQSRDIVRINSATAN